MALIMLWDSLVWFGTTIFALVLIMGLIFLLYYLVIPYVPDVPKKRR